MSWLAAPAAALTRRGTAAWRSPPSGARATSSATKAAAPTLTVWGRTSSSNTQKVMWMLAELGLPYTLVPASARLGPTSELLGSTEVFGVVGTAE